MHACRIIMLVEWVVFLVLAWYLEQVGSLPHYLLGLPARSLAEVHTLSNWPFLLHHQDECIC